MVCKSYLSIILSSPTPPNRYTRFISIVSRCGCRFFLFLFVAVFSIFNTIPDYTAGQPRPPPSRARLCGRMVSFSWYCSPCAEDENSYYSNRTKKERPPGISKTCMRSCACQDRWIFDDRPGPIPIPREKKPHSNSWLCYMAGRRLLPYHIMPIET